MPNKQRSRNAYFFFALDMVPELRRRGLQVSGVREAIPLCSGDWALLTTEQREKYAEKAKMWKRDHSDSPGPERASGSSGPEQAQEKLEEARDRATHYMTMLKKSEGLDTKVIYIINIFSHGEMPSTCDQRFLPCEIGCVRFSLRNGIEDSFHAFIDPGEIPLGFRYHCQAGSDSTHKIPVSGFNLANRDYHNLYRALCDFICPVPSIHVEVYCMSSDIYRLRWCLEWLACKAGMENRLKVWDIENLVQKFYRDKLDEEPSRSSVKRLLYGGYWDYASNTRCTWHEENDMWCCALASCKKITYCISKALASVYDVTLTPAHLPDLEPQKKFSGDNKTIIIEASRYQKNASTGSLGTSPTAGECSTVEMRGVVLPPSGQGRGAVPFVVRQGCGAGCLPVDQGRGAGHLPMHLARGAGPIGVVQEAAPIPFSKARGRGILRLLEEFSPFQPTEE